MRYRSRKLFSSVAAVLLMGGMGGCKDAEPKAETSAPPPAVKTQETPKAAAAAPIEVTLCDNETKATLDNPVRSVGAGQQIANTLMMKWKQKHPDVDWEAEERKSRTFIPAADNSGLLSEDTQGSGHPYRNFGEQDVAEWKRATEELVVAGSKVFHSADELGSTIAVSCDMCHPNASNTHPETYPKFQTQMGRVALLRDMINWCLQHPVRAPTMSADDPRMRALEAYIVSQRAGQPLAYGKH